jgi:hypothetical protein
MVLISVTRIAVATQTVECPIVVADRNAECHVAAFQFASATLAATLRDEAPIPVLESVAVFSEARFHATDYPQFEEREHLLCEEEEHPQFEE